MTRARIALLIFGALVIAFGAGYAMGAAGRITSQTAASDARFQLDVAEARARLLDARVSVYGIDFGQAGRHLEEAKAPLRRVQEHYRTVRKTAAANSIGTALTLVGEAQQLASKLDQTSNAKAGEALEAMRVASTQ